MSHAVAVGLASRGGHQRRVLTLAEHRVQHYRTVQAGTLMESSAQSLAGTRPLLWLNSCSWCCGDLMPSVPRAGLRRICIYCGRPEPVEIQHQQGRHQRARDCAVSAPEALTWLELSRRERLSSRSALLRSS